MMLTHPEIVLAKGDSTMYMYPVHVGLCNCNRRGSCVAVCKDNGYGCYQEPIMGSCCYRCNNTVVAIDAISKDKQCTC